ncbi:MAG: hypothetical protein IMW98_08520 [Firmicutes bacterium]|nr:hypothetical protein [Bacillota bacterium]MBE3590849.1 hypothetical protein [Bacillota bacterium]
MGEVSRRDHFAAAVLSGLMMRYREDGYTDRSAIDEAFRLADYALGYPDRPDTLVDALREAREALVLMLDAFGPLVSIGEPGPDMYLRVVATDNASAALAKIDAVLGDGGDEA